MRAKIYSSLICVSILVASCLETPKEVEVLDSKSSDMIVLLQSIYPDKDIRLISDDESGFSFYSEGYRITIKEMHEGSDELSIMEEDAIDVTLLSVETDVKNFILRISELSHKNQTCDSEDPVICDIISKKIEIFDEDYNLILSRQKSRSLQDGQDSIFDDGGGNGCTSDNVMDCMLAHCKDAGALLCGACLLSRYCSGALIVICSADVLFENENPLYCD
jgi:hypothetical protein